MAANLDFIDAAIVSKYGNAASILLDQTFRDYEDTCFAREDLGSRPYNENVIWPRIRPQWKFSSGKPLAQRYDVFRNNYLTLLQSDNIHHTPAGQAAMRQTLIDTIFKVLLTGQLPVELPMMNSVIIKAALNPGAAPSLWNRADIANPTTTSLVDFGGSYSDTSWDLVTTAPALTATGSTGKSTGNNSGVVPDLVLQNFTFVDSGRDNGIGAGKLGFKISGLDKSRVYSAHMGGSRDVVDSRITSYTVGGDTKQLDAAGNTLNQTSHLALRPDINGELSVVVERVNHQFGYAGWLVLTMDAG